MLVAIERYADTRNVERTLNSTLKEVNRKLRRMIHIATGEFKYASHTMAYEIQKNPLRSGFIALGTGIGIGFIAGILSRR